MPIPLNRCTKISDFKKYSESLDISHANMHLKSKIKSEDNKKELIVNTTSFYNKYYWPIYNISFIRTFTDSEYLKYKLQPKLYCYEEFGTTELWSLILKVNNMTSTTQFNIKKIRTFNKEEIFKILNEIRILEQKNIDDNAMEIL